MVSAPEKRSIYAQSIQPAHFYKIDCQTAHTFKLLKGMKNVKLFNSDIESKTRFLVDCDGVGCGWFRIDKYKEIKEQGNQQRNTQIQVSASFNDLHGIEKAENANFRTLSFDIECRSDEGFANPKRDNDQIITIGMCTVEETTGDQKNVVLQLGTVAPLHSGHCMSCKTE